MNVPSNTQVGTAVILLVDDERTILDSLKGQLRNLFGRRFRYEAAENVPEAWEVLEELDSETIDVVLIVSDWLMPGVRGDEFLTAVRQRFPQTARVMLTGQADASAIQRAYDEAKVVKVMHKPWSIEELRLTVEACAPSAGMSPSARQPRVRGV
jgi:response regulator RpfG family c-di-GMP phosphodiesterase